MFLTPYLRRPYELYYFCNLSDEVIIIIDKETYNKYSDSFDEFRSFNFQYHIVSLDKSRISRFFNFSSTAALTNYNEAQLSKIIQEKKITTIVSVEMFSSLSVQASHISSKFCLKHVVIVWENMKRSILYFVPPFSVNTRIVKSSASKLVAVSNTSKQSLISLHINEDKIETIYPGIFIERFKPSTDSVDKILFVGNLEPFKGVDILLQVFKKLSTHFANIKLILVGKGSLEPEVIKLQNSGLKIEHNEYIPHSRLTAVYRDCSIYCSPSRNVKKARLITTLQEQFGFTLIEAMASGLPLVSSNIGSIPEIVGPHNLTLAPTVGNIFDGLYKLLTCDDLRKTLREKNRRRCISLFDASTQSLMFKKVIGA